MMIIKCSTFPIFLQKLAAVVGIIGGLSKDSYSSNNHAIDVAATAVAQETMSEAAETLKLRQV
jgi:hypothetical protein